MIHVFYEQGFTKEEIMETIKSRQADQSFRQFRIQCQQRPFNT